MKLKIIDDIYAFRNVIFKLVSQQLVLRYRRTTLGYIWTLVNPLLMMSVTALVFSNVFKMDLKVYALFLFTGMIPWNCFSSIATQTGSSFLNNEGLIKKIYLPKIIFPLSVAVGLLIDNILSLLSLFIIVLILGARISGPILLLPLGYLFLFLFSFGIAMFISILSVYFRDLQYVIQVIMQAWFFLTPVMYKSNAVFGKLASLVKFNPIVPYIDFFRSCMYEGVIPSETIWFQVIIYSVISISSGYFFFLSKENKIIFRL